MPFPSPRSLSVIRRRSPAYSLIFAETYMQPAVLLSVRSDRHNLKGCMGAS